MRTRRLHCIVFSTFTKDVMFKFLRADTMVIGDANARAGLELL